MTADLDSAGARLGVVEARVLTKEIRASVARTFDALAEVEAAIARAYEGRAWYALGYPDWQTYCGAEFSPSRLWSSVEQRQARTLSLRQAGLSQRAIAAVLGVGASTTDRDMKGITAPDGALISDVTGSDGTTRPRPTAESKPVTEDLIKRRLKVARLSDEGLSQGQSAVRVGVSQPTVSTDLREIQALSDQAPEALREVVQSDEMTYRDLMAKFEMVTIPKVDLGRLAANVLRDLELQAHSLYESVVLDNEWIVTSQRRAAVKALVPKIGSVLLLITTALSEIQGEDFPDDEDVRFGWSHTLDQVRSALAKIVTP